MSTPRNSTSDQSETRHPKPVASRFDAAFIQRMNAVAQALSRKLGMRIKKSNVLEICVANHLPVLEKEVFPVLADGHNASLEGHNAETSTPNQETPL